MVDTAYVLDESMAQMVTNLPAMTRSQMKLEIHLVEFLGNKYLLIVIVHLLWSLHSEVDTLILNACSTYSELQMI